MPFHSRFLFLSALGFGLISQAAFVQAETFNWTNITYAPTPTVATSATPQTLGSGGSSNTLSIQFGLNNGATFQDGPQSPAVDSYSTNGSYASGGNADTARFLQIGADMVNGTGGIGSITVNLFFAKPVTSLTFSFFDVDTQATGSAPFTDQIRGIQATSAAGPVVYPTTVTNGGPTSANTVAGSGSTYTITAASNNPNNLAGGNATVTFSSVTPITELTFVYGDNLHGHRRPRPGPTRRPFQLHLCYGARTRHDSDARAGAGRAGRPGFPTPPVIGSGVAFIFRIPTARPGRTPCFVSGGL